MQIPLQISFRKIDDALAETAEALVRERTAKLEELAPDMIACRVAVERPQKHQRMGNPYRTRIEVTLPPGKDLVVDKEPGNNEFHQDLHRVLRRAFSAMERRVKKTVALRRREVKHHEERENRAIVVRLFPESRYGFLKTLDGEEYYFHRNAVLHGDFEILTIGAEVRFTPHLGDEGRQASSVQLESKPGVRRSSPQGDMEVGVPSAWGPNG